MIRKPLLYLSALLFLITATYWLRSYIAYDAFVYNGPQKLATATTDHGWLQLTMVFDAHGPARVHVDAPGPIPLSQGLSHFAFSEFFACNTVLSSAGMTGWTARPDFQHFQFTFQDNSAQKNKKRIHLTAPLWPAPAVFALYPAITLIAGPLRRRQRRKKNLCTNCAYNLTGNTSGKCPECGTEIK